MTDQRTSAPNSTPRLPQWFIAAGIVLMIVLVYGNALRGGFIWDDDAHITNNGSLRSLEGLKEIWVEPDATPQYYPLVHTTFWLEYQLWELRPFGYHLVNALLHGLNAVLLGLVLRRLSIRGAWLAAAIFALHPVHVESVAWITERKNVLSGAFYLSALLVYLGFSRSLSAPRPESESTTDAAQSWPRYFLAFGLYICALLSKSVTCTLPAAILLLVWWKRGRVRLRDVVPLLPFLVIGIAAAVNTAFLEKQHVGAVGADWALSTPDRFLIAGRALWFYAGKLIWPSTLTFIYPRWEVGAATGWQYLFPLSFLAVVLALWFLRRRIGRGPLAGALFFAGTLGPALGFVDVFPFRYSFVADHFQYLASIGLIVLFAEGVVRTSTRLFLFSDRGAPHPALRAVPAAVLLLLLGALTVRQTSAYRNEETLWLDVLGKNPNAPIAYTNLGAYYAETKMYGEAETVLQNGIEIAPEDVDLLTNLGMVYLQTDRHDDARARLERALEIDPQNPWVLNGLGRIFAAEGNADQAVDAFRMAIRIHPAFIEPFINLALTLADAGKVEEAVEELERALAIEPDHPALTSHLENLRQKMISPSEPSR